MVEAVEGIEDIELKLLLGQPVFINNIYIFSPLLKDVIENGYTAYNQALSSLLFDKNKFPELKNLEQSNLDFIIYFFEKDIRFRESFKLGSKLMFKEDVFVDIIDDYPSLRIGEHQISDETIESIQKIVKFANKVPDKSEEEFNPANSKAEEFIKKIMGDRAKKPQKKPINNLHSLISGLAWKSHNISILDMEKLTIYQFYDGYFRLENIDHYNNIMMGIYSGNIDSTKIKIQENTWTKIIR
ncbi:hypothetical protein SAMN04487895_101749 [Paenibacillus sophorae]|uniref:Uncharacterized protein n=1 Tax=Paenibacillus sophorae TaxID=1333845 RepID=A0A1H8H3Z1_9BACL|nr:hypothetical protein [Paenibacillus sophorae]QWU14437.1 hypothetical protein KP014_21250 [Paenibacillus sophorae]SEN50956.1 hypothetical protein SAMN04487895_101749 [Paenibacillus sophorae]